MMVNKIFYSIVYLMEKGIIKRLWNLWAKALGEKASDNNSEADLIAWIRTIIVLISIVTNLFICAGIVRHWNQ